MLYVLLILIALLIAVLILHVRLRAAWSRQDRLVAMSVGQRSGIKLDFLDHSLSLRLFGLTVHRRPMGKRAEGKERRAEKKKTPPPGEKSGKARRRKKWSVMYRRLRDLLPSILTASWRFVQGLLRAGIVEELEARIEAGFDQPDRTGVAFGCYQAMLGMAPAMVGRLVYVPDWTGASFAASGRLTVSIPLYRLLWRLMVLVWQLPSRKILKLAIQKKDKGEQDVE